MTDLPQDRGRSGQLDVVEPRSVLGHWLHLTGIPHSALVRKLTAGTDEVVVRGSAQIQLNLDGPLSETGGDPLPARYLPISRPLSQSVSRFVTPRAGCCTRRREGLRIGYKTANCLRCSFSRPAALLDLQSLMSSQENGLPRRQTPLLPSFTARLLIPCNSLCHPTLDP